MSCQAAAANPEASTAVAIAGLTERARIDKTRAIISVEPDSGGEPVAHRLILALLDAGICWITR